MDPLSSVLSLVKLRGYYAAALTGGGRWSFRFETSHAGIKCYVIAKGACYAVIDGVKQPVKLATGDCLMLPHGNAFKLCSDLKTRAKDARVLLTNAPTNGIRSFAPGDDMFILGGHFALDGNAGLLLDVLPPFVHLDRDADKHVLRGSVERMLDEMRAPQPGGSLIAQQCAYTMLVLALRSCVSRERGVGWLYALADERIARAMTSMHDEPAAAWTVEALAETAGMSRTTFAERFRDTVGASPLEYLTRWRMQLAGDRLRTSRDSIGALARLVGYDSESAFGAAFKRVMGASPRAYRRQVSPLP